MTTATLNYWAGEAASYFETAYESFHSRLVAVTEPHRVRPKPVGKLVVVGIARGVCPLLGVVVKLTLRLGHELDGGPNHAGMADRLIAGQYVELREIWQSVRASLEAL